MILTHLFLQPLVYFPVQFPRVLLGGGWQKKSFKDALKNTTSVRLCFCYVLFKFFRTLLVLHRDSMTNF